MNDDNINRSTGAMANLLPQETVSSLIRKANRDFCVLARKPKTCARSVALVSTQWLSFVRNSPRLWLCHFLVSDGRRLNKGHTEIDLGEQVEGLLKASQNCDIDLHFWDETSLRTRHLLLLIRPTIPQWRSAHIDSSSSRFPEVWMGLQGGFPIPVRLQYFSLLCGAGDASGFGSGWRVPNLRYASISHPGEAITQFSFLSSVVSLKIMDVLASALGLSDWLMVLVTSLPSLQVLDLSTSVFRLPEKREASTHWPVCQIVSASA